MKIEIEIDDLVGYQFKSDENKVVHFEDMSRREQIKVLNALASGYELFINALKEEYMETKFNSQICTTREQSERLLSLGLKKETADMCHMPFRIKVDGEPLDYTEHCSLPHGKDIPAWSLHRLIEMMPMSLAEDKVYHEYWNLNVTPIAVIYRNQDKEDEWIGECMGRGLYNNLIDCIEWLIKEGYFNKEYLV